MAKYPSQLQDKFNLRLPDGMKDRIAEKAKSNGRSMNSEIIQILEDSLSSGISLHMDDEFAEKYRSIVEAEYTGNDAIDIKLLDENLNTINWLIDKFMERIGSDTSKFKELLEIKKKLLDK